MKTLKCLRCGYEWRPIRETLPKVCPACKSHSWNLPYKRVKKPQQE